MMSWVARVACRTSTGGDIVHHLVIMMTVVMVIMMTVVMVLMIIVVIVMMMAVEIVMMLTVVIVLMMVVKMVMMVMAMIVEVVMMVMILDGEEILGYVTTVTSFQVNVDNQRKDHRWVESAFSCGNDHLAVRIVATSPNARVPWRRRRRRWRSSTSIHSVTSKTRPIIWKEVRSYSLLCLLILIQAFIRKCTPALAVDPIFRWVGVEALIGGGAGVWVTRGVSWMR